MVKTKKKLCEAFEKNKCEDEKCDKQECEKKPRSWGRPQESTALDAREQEK